MHSKKSSIIVLIYILLFVQFFISNWFFLIGADYTPKSAITSYNNWSGPIIVNCPAEPESTATVWSSAHPLPEKPANIGFPFGIAVDRPGGCGPSEYEIVYFQGFNIDRILNAVYILLVSLLCLGLHFVKNRRIVHRGLWLLSLFLVLMEITNELTTNGLTFIFGALSGLALIFSSVVVATKILRKNHIKSSKS